MPTMHQNNVPIAKPEAVPSPPAPTVRELIERARDAAREAAVLHAGLPGAAKFFAAMGDLFDHHPDGDPDDGAEEAADELGLELGDAGDGNGVDGHSVE